jgi:2,6-dihydroxypseudooxynicotine hydrolase
LFDVSDKGELQARCRLNFEKLAPLLDPEALRLEVPFKSSLLPGYFRLARPGAPCVILIGGLDSAKEVELGYFAEGFLARGNSVFFFDGPGQGELCGQLPMATDFEHAVSNVIDYLLTHVEIDGQRVGLFGVSFGGYLACRTAASDQRIKACVSLGGFFDSKIFERLSPLAGVTLRRTFGLRESEDLSAIAGQISLEQLRGRMDRPLFILHGRDDHLVDEGQIAAIREWACGPKKVWIVDGAEHVCTNRFSECLPELSDWMSEQLTSPMNLSLGLAAGCLNYE